MIYCMTDTCDKYVLHENIGVIPDEFHVIEVGDTTRSVCRRLCSETHDLTCSGFLYNRRLRSCYLSPYTGEWLRTDALSFDSSSGLEFYRRIRCLGQSAILSVSGRLVPHISDSHRRLI